MIGRYLLILLAVTMVSSLCVFFLYVPILPAMGIAAVLMAMVVMFGLGMHVGQDPAVAAAHTSLRDWWAGASVRMRNGFRSLQNAAR